MSNMKELYEKVAADTNLQAKFQGIMAAAENAGKGATEEKLVAFAKEAGFEVVPAEIETFFSEMSEKREGELTDSELDAVAGGKGGIGALVSIAGGGIGCGITSAIAEVVSGNCKGLLNSDTGQTW